MTASGKKNRTLSALWACLALSLLVVSMAGRERETSILLTIGGDLRPGEDVDSITIRITDGEEPLLSDRT